MVNPQSGLKTKQERLEEAARRLAGADTDSLVVFWRGLCNLCEELSLSHISLSRIADDELQELYIFVDGIGVIKVGKEADRLDREVLTRFLTTRDEENKLAKVVYDFLDDLWRSLNGQEVGNPPKMEAV